MGITKTGGGVTFAWQAANFLPIKNISYAFSVSANCDAVAVFFTGRGGNNRTINISRARKTGADRYFQTKEAFRK